MNRARQLLIAAAALLAAPLLAAWAFYSEVVARDGLTNYWSIFFGFQVFIVGAITLGVAIWLARNKQLRKHLAPLIIAVATILVVVTPSWVSISTRRYITGEGGPAGPSFNCLLWGRVGLFSTYDKPWELTCELMSIPSYSKFWIDQDYAADQTDASRTYYLTFAALELALLSGTAASLLLARRPAKEK